MLKTPERSLSDLFSTSRAADATTGCGASPVLRRHHPVQRQLERASRVTEEVGDTAQRLVLVRVEHMKDRADQQRVRSLFPMVATFKRTIGIDQNVGHVLHVAYFVRAAPDFQQRVVGCRLRISGVEQQAMAEPRAPAGSERPVLAFDVVNDDGRRPTQQGGNDRADAFTRARRREGQDVLRAFVPQVLALMMAEKDTDRLRQSGLANIGGVGPAGRAIGRHFACGASATPTWRWRPPQPAGRCLPRSCRRCRTPAAHRRRRRTTTRTASTGNRPACRVSRTGRARA